MRFLEILEVPGCPDIDKCSTEDIESIVFKITSVELLNEALLMLDQINADGIDISELTTKMEKFLKIYDYTYFF